MDDKRLKEIKAREQAATEGEWEPVEGHPSKLLTCYSVFANNDAMKDIPVVMSHSWLPTQADADFIANAKQDIPYLLALVESQRAEIERLRLIVELAKELDSRWCSLYIEQPHPSGVQEVRLKFWRLVDLEVQSQEEE